MEVCRQKTRFQGSAVEGFRFLHKFQDKGVPLLWVEQTCESFSSKLVLMELLPPINNRVPIESIKPEPETLTPEL